MAITVPPLTLDDFFGEFSAGITAEQILAHVKEQARVTVNADDKAIPKKHAGKITIEINFDKFQGDEILVSHQVKTQCPVLNGSQEVIGHKTLSTDPEQTRFYVHPGSGYPSVNPINQDDWITETDKKIAQFNQR